jgi:hypothetical protein
MDVLERNYGRWERMEKDAGWEVLGLFKTLDAARAAELDLKRKTAELLDRAAENLAQGSSSRKDCLNPVVGGG